jgi:hypothetical protein
MNYLEICQRVAKLSGTIGDNLPASVVSQTGRLGLIVTLVQMAWDKIQNARADWNWARSEYDEKALIVGQNAYTGIGLGLSDHKFFIVDKYTPVLCYRVADGIAQQYELIPLDWGTFRKRYLVGNVTDSAPFHVTIRPRDGALMIGPAPNEAYKIAGEYLLTNQVLSASADIPRLPTIHHDVLVHQTLVDLAGYDEAAGPYQFATADLRVAWQRLVHDQIPNITVTWAYKP